MKAIFSIFGVTAIALLVWTMVFNKPAKTVEDYNEIAIEDPEEPGVKLIDAKDLDPKEQAKIDKELKSHFEKVSQDEYRIEEAPAHEEASYTTVTEFTDDDSNQLMDAIFSSN